MSLKSPNHEPCESSSKPAHKLYWNRIHEHSGIIVLFINYSPFHILYDHVRDYLRAFKENGCRIYFIQNSDLPDLRPLEGLDESLVDAYLARENRGLDFAAWAQALQLSPGLWDSDTLIFCNDSVFAPLNRAHFKTLISRIQTSVADFIGLTESHERKRHFQSYFFALKNLANRQLIYQKFWHAIRPLDDKKEIIDTYEVGHLQFLLDHGCSSECLFPLSNESGGNPSLLYWKELIAVGFPLLKIEAVRRCIERPDWLPVVIQEGYNQQFIDDFITKNLALNPNFLPLDRTPLKLEAKRKAKQKLTFRQKWKRSILKRLGKFNPPQ